VNFIGYLREVRFSYNTKDVPECHKIGRCEAQELDKTTYFPIDGPEGEYIDAIDIYTLPKLGPTAQWYYWNGWFESVKVNPSIVQFCQFSLVEGF
jgi:hypothetical protein